MGRSKKVGAQAKVTRVLEQPGRDTQVGSTTLASKPLGGKAKHRWRKLGRARVRTDRKLKRSGLPLRLKEKRTKVEQQG